MGLITSTVYQIAPPGSNWPGLVGMRDAVYKEKGDAKELTTSAEETKARWVEHSSEVYDAEITTPKFTRLLYHRNLLAAIASGTSQHRAQASHRSCPR